MHLFEKEGVVFIVKCLHVAFGIYHILLLSYHNVMVHRLGKVWGIVGTVRSALSC